jgi:hypothetical protein
MRNGNTEGQPLIVMLSTRMAIEGIRPANMARALGISRSYLSQLVAGDKQLSSLNDDALRAVARYLRLPPVVCFVLAGKLRHADFLDPGTEYEASLRGALERIAESPFGLEAIVNKGMLWELPEPVKMLLALLYQAASGVELFPPKKRWPWVATEEASIFFSTKGNS